MFQKCLENIVASVIIIVHVVFIVTVILFLESGADSLCHNPTVIMPGWQPLYPNISSSSSTYTGVTVYASGSQLVCFKTQGLCQTEKKEKIYFAILHF